MEENGIGTTIVDDEMARVAHYERVIDCYLDVMKWASNKARGILLANPDDKPLGFFIPSVAQRSVDRKVLKIWSRKN